MAGADAEEVVEFVIASAESLSGCEALKAAHTSDAAFDAPVILLQPVVSVSTGSMDDSPAECPADRQRVGAVTVRGDPVGDLAGGRLRRTEEGLGRRHVAVLAEHRVDQPPVPVDGPVQIDPAASDLGVCFINMPVATAGTTRAMPAPPEFVGQDWRELGPAR